MQDKRNGKYRVTALIGYTYNEVENGRVSILDYAIAKYPLHEWKWNELEVSEFLRERQIMNPLYNHFKRTGCYLCPKQSKASLYHPNLLLCGIFIYCSVLINSLLITPCIIS